MAPSRLGAPYIIFVLGLWAAPTVPAELAGACARGGQCSMAAVLAAQTEVEVEATEQAEVAGLELRLLQLRSQSPAGSRRPTEASRGRLALLLRFGALLRAPGQGSCAGDGTPTENPNCRVNPSRSGCTWSPGCNWGGESHFNGWCSGEERCVYTSDINTCASTAGCRWVRSAKPVDVAAEQLADAADAAAARDAMAEVDSTARQLANCSGDGTATENVMCKYIKKEANCKIGPGCNWHGASSFGGWCRGSQLCPLLAVEPSCQTHADCEWVPATADVGPAGTPPPGRAQNPHVQMLSVDRVRRHASPGVLLTGSCNGDGTANENPSCRHITYPIGCTWTPGCNWDGASNLNGWCSGSQDCAQASDSSHCSEQGCRWVQSKAPLSLLSERAGDNSFAPDAAKVEVGPSGGAAAGVVLGHSPHLLHFGALVRTSPLEGPSPPASCVGDGTVLENPSCKTNPSRSGCTWSPGCNWDGESHFGGWCSGAKNCVWTGNIRICTSMRGCRWVPSVRPVNLTAEREADEADAAAAVEAAVSGDIVSRTMSGCQGDGTAWENPMCKYIQSTQYCTMSPGCNFHGRSFYGGWCSGNPLCVGIVIEIMCLFNPSCYWNRANA